MSQDRRARETVRLPLADEGARGQIEDETSIHFRVETEVEVIQCSMLGSRNSAGLLAPSFQQAVAAAGQFVADQARDQIDGGHRLRL